MNQFQVLNFTLLSKQGQISSVLFVISKFEQTIVASELQYCFSCDKQNLTYSVFKIQICPFCDVSSFIVLNSSDHSLCFEAETFCLKTQTMLPESHDLCTTQVVPCVMS